MREAAGGHFVVGADNVETDSRWVFVQHDIDATPFVDGIPDNAAIDARIAPWARAGQVAPAPGGLSQTQVDARIATWARAGDATAIPAGKLSNAPSSSGGGGSALTPAALPSAATSAKGTLANEGGDLYELVSDDEQPNVFHFVASARTTFRDQRAGHSDQVYVRTGGAGIAWTGAGQGNAALHGAWRALLSKAALGDPPPSDLYVHVRADRAVADVHMQRPTAAPVTRYDTSTHWAYLSVAGEPGIDAGAGAVVEAHWYSDVRFSVAQKVHSGNRWEKWVDLADLSHIADWALTVGGEAAERTGIANLMNAAAADAERLDFNALKNRPPEARLIRALTFPALVGYAVTTTVSQRTALTAVSNATEGFAPMAEGLRGVILAHVRATSATPASLVSFGPTTAYLGGFVEVLVSDLLADDGQYAAASNRGVKIGDIQVGFGGTTESVVSLYLARDANRNLGYYIHNDAKISTGGRGPFSVQFDVDLTFLPSDAPAAAASGGGGVTRTVFAAGMTGAGQAARTTRFVAAGINDFIKRAKAGDLLMVTMTFSGLEFSGVTPLGGPAANGQKTVDIAASSYNRQTYVYDVQIGPSDSVTMNVYRDGSLNAGLSSNAFSLVGVEFG